ncbi:MAG: hypothetical protein JWO36_3257 [Myxococcales bacterium]|nr:hypothetical protein [Myxococcales bacterium]
MLTRRCTQRQFLLCPDKETNDLDLGLAGKTLRIPRDQALAFVERLYRSVARPGYTERIG